MNEEVILKIMEIVNKLIKDLDQDLLRLETEIIINESLNYMNRGDIPEILINIIAKELYQSVDNGGRENIEFIKEGDTTIKYNVSNSGNLTFHNIIPHLQKWRKLKVVS